MQIKEDLTDKKISVDVGKRMAILEQATISEFDTRIHKERYDTWGMTAVISQKSLNPSSSESGDSVITVIEREIDNPEIDNLLLSASRDLKIYLQQGQPMQIHSLMNKDPATLQYLKPKCDNVKIS